MLCLSRLAGLLVVACALGFVVGGCGEKPETNSDFEGQVREYIEKFPYQDTHDYSVKYTQGDPSKLNTLTGGPPEPSLARAGEDIVVRSNNDTFYTGGFVLLEDGPVILRSDAPSQDRFFSFQLMDDRNINYRNIIRPSGSYTLYFGEKPNEVVGEAIEVPSNLSAVLVRVEVMDKNDPEDVAAATAVYKGITMEGPVIEEFPALDLLSEFDPKVAEEANRRMDEAFATVPFTDTIPRPGQELGKDVPYLHHAAGTKGAWGGPVPSHSAYEMIFVDQEGETLDGTKGTFTLTTTAPPVDAFWSITVYDTARGGHLHPNEDNRYHINNTGAVRNEDGTYTFTFKTKCEDGDLNCVEVPAGPFDLTARYYLPKEEIISGTWTMPRPKLQQR